MIPSWTSRQGGESRSERRAAGPRRWWRNGGNPQPQSLHHVAPIPHQGAASKPACEEIQVRPTPVTAANQRRYLSTASKAINPRPRPKGRRLAGRIAPFEPGAQRRHRKAHSGLHLAPPPPSFRSRSPSRPPKPNGGSGGVPPRRVRLRPPPEASPLKYPPRGRLPRCGDTGCRGLSPWVSSLTRSEMYRSSIFKVTRPVCAYRPALTLPPGPW